SGPTTASYSYNGDGLRMSKTVNGTTQQLTYDQSSSLPLLIEDQSQDFIYGPGGLTLEQVSGTTADFFLHDWPGSTMGLASSSGSLVARYTYDAYGNLTSSSGSASTPLLFQGQFRDAETGLYYLLSRYYDPATEQFLTRDPGSALIPYAFAGGDPTNLSDPSGQMISRGMVGSGEGGPTVLAPPPATNQAAYYHQVTQETTYHAPPAYVAPQVADSVSPASVQAPSPAPSSPAAPPASAAFTARFGIAAPHATGQGGINVGAIGAALAGGLGAVTYAASHPAAWVRHHEGAILLGATIAAGVAIAACTAGVGVTAIMGIVGAETAGEAAAGVAGLGIIASGGIASYVVGVSAYDQLTGRAFRDPI
ncbi:MAG: RHS repeat-associated core domain-containing protein, partial [Candidatus Dormibacteria bacterium]